MNKNLLSILVPIIALAGWTLMHEYRFVSGMEIRLKIQGYDPRDLLSGHYMRYSLNLGDVQPCSGQKTGTSCICLVPSDDGIYGRGTSEYDCNELQRNKYCSVYLRGSCQSGRYESGLERFSIPEEWAPVLEILPPNSSISLSLDKFGNGQVKEMFVDNEPLQAYAARRLNELSMIETAPLP